MQRSTILLAVMAAALPLAACGSKTETANNSAAAATSNGTEMSADTLGAKIRALPEGQRRGVLFRAIRDAGPSGQPPVGHRDEAKPPPPTATRPGTQCATAPPNGRSC